MKRRCDEEKPVRRAFLQGVVAAGAAASSAALGLSVAQATGQGPLTSGDRAILTAALVAEALAVTTYAHILRGAPFYRRLFPQDQAYLQAAYQQEMAHYVLLRSLVNEGTPRTAFFYPKAMFADARTTVSTLVTLEEAFIAAYLVGVRDLSRSDLRVAAARIMGVESDHRTMARVLAPGLDPADGGPLRTVSGIKGVAEQVDPASNNAFERTLGWTGIDQALATLQPFIDPKAAARAHFDSARAYAFTPFTPHLTTPLGAF